MEEFYSSPDEPQTSLYYLLERVSCKRDCMYLGIQGTTFKYVTVSVVTSFRINKRTFILGYHKHIIHSDTANVTYYIMYFDTCCRITGHLGSGQFGIVEKGTWQGKEVALKTLKEGSDEEDKVKFLQEAAIMAQFRHPNIVTLHGVYSQRQRTRE